jgi:hypothetical protein
VTVDDKEFLPIHEADADFVCQINELMAFGWQIVQRRVDSGLPMAF